MMKRVSWVVATAVVTLFVAGSAWASASDLASAREYACAPIPFKYLENLEAVRMNTPATAKTAARHEMW